MGKEEVMPHDERYLAAEEYMEIVYRYIPPPPPPKKKNTTKTPRDRLWEQSWEDGAQTWQTDPEMAYNPRKIHKINFSGDYFKISAFHQTHPSPQRTPLLYQAGSSKSGIAFGGKHAEAIFCANPTISSCKKYTTAVRLKAVLEGRSPSSIKFFLGIMPIIGRTIEEAEAKYERAKKYVSINGGLARFSGFTNVDLSQYGVDEEFDFEGTHHENTIQGVIDNIKVIGEEKVFTPRIVAEMFALGGSGPRPVGTPEMVADFFEEWWREGDLDGFNVNCTFPTSTDCIIYVPELIGADVTNPGSFEDVVELLIPELQKRGIYWNDYAVPGGTARENLYGKEGEKLLALEHPGAKFRWNAPTSSNGESKPVEANDTASVPPNKKRRIDAA